MKNLTFLSTYGSAKHLDQAIDHVRSIAKTEGHLDPNITAFHVGKMLRNKEFNKEHHDKLSELMAKPNNVRAWFSIASPHTPTKMFDDELANPNGDFEIKTMSMVNHRASMDGFRSAMKDPDFRMRSVAVLHHKDGSLLNAAIHDPEPYVRRQVLLHQKRTKEHLQHLTNDSDKGIADDAKSELSFWENMTK